VRSQTRGERHDELVFVGMKAPKMYNEALEREMALGYKKRKQEQAYNRDAYLKDLTELRVRGHAVKQRGGWCSVLSYTHALRESRDDRSVLSYVHSMLATSI
jgi:hypothetical protein